MSRGASKPKGKAGRPPALNAYIPHHPSLTRERVDSMLRWIESGRSLRSWCEVDGSIDRHTIFRALETSDDLRTQYMRAREIQAHAIVDECLEIADDGRNDTYTDDHGNVKVSNDVIQRSKLRCDERHWMAGRLLPKVYGDKMRFEDETPPPLQPEQVRERYLARQNELRELEGGGK